MEELIHGYKKSFLKLLRNYGFTISYGTRNDKYTGNKTYYDITIEELNLTGSGTSIEESYDSIISYILDNFSFKLKIVFDKNNKFNFKIKRNKTARREQNAFNAESFKSKKRRIDK